MAQNKLDQQLEQYTALAKADKKIDVTALMLNALQNHESNVIPPKQKRWAYLISLSVPPVGLFFAVKFYLSGKDDANEAAIMCVVLTGVSILLAVIFANVLVSGSGTSLQQIQNIKPADYQGL